jgi:hypothetical protein
MIPDDYYQPCLKAPTKLIVYPIQSILSGVHALTSSPLLDEDLSQIITIISSSIVAVCNNNLPPASAQQGSDILREHANQLSEVQAMWRW